MQEYDIEAEFWETLSDWSDQSLAGEIRQGVAGLAGRVRKIHEDASPEQRAALEATLREVSQDIGILLEGLRGANA
jgi:hypothetical protein